MTMHYCVSVRDTATETYSRPFFVPHVAAAVRDFGRELNSGNPEASMLAAHPSDFELWQLALFDDETGTFDMQQERLARGKDLIQAKQ